MPSRPVRCVVLGESTIQIDGRTLETESDLVFGLALYALVQAGERLNRDDVASLLWPQHDEEAAHHCLRQLAYRLRTLKIPLQSTAGFLYVDPADAELDYAPLLMEKPPRELYLAIQSFDVLPGYAPH